MKMPCTIIILDVENYSTANCDMIELSFPLNESSMQILFILGKQLPVLAA